MEQVSFKNKILVADDNIEIQEILSILLTGDGYDVVITSDGDEAAELADDSFSLVILDVNMPKKSGFLACADIRKKTLIPILFLTARTLESDKTMGFLAGGDDYIAKPFSNSELLLRVKALIRRHVQYGASAPSAIQPILNIHDLVMNTDTKSVLKNEKVIQLTTTEYDILELLASHRKKIFSIDNIYSSIWNDSYLGASDNTIMVHIKNLRKKIGDNPRNPQYIKTAWGKGYYVD